MKVSKEDVTPAFVFDGVLQPEKCIVYEHEASLSQCGLIPAASLRIRGNMLVTYENSKLRKNKGNKGKGKYGKGQKITRCSCKYRHCRFYYNTRLLLYNLQSCFLLVPKAKRHTLR